MTGNTLFDACRIFKHACAFADCAVFCEREPKSVVVRSQQCAVPDIVNSAFACEVFMKSIIVYNEISLDDICKLNHGLINLWEKLRIVDNSFTTCVEMKIKDEFEIDGVEELDELLNNVSDAFKKWRYIYEKHGGSIYIGFLRSLREILRESCCEKLYKRTWDEYVKGDCSG